MFALARVALERVSTPVVPASAVRGEGTRSRLFAVVQGRLEERLVQLGEREADVIAIAKGVAAGDFVASDAAEPLEDGLRVQ
jgi:hypothetical protein